MIFVPDTAGRGRGGSNRFAKQTGADPGRFSGKGASLAECRASVNSRCAGGRATWGDIEPLPQATPGD
ncbi:hypothetical protein GCM10007973_24450 [Polymorphobacter multimanifer]|nr:hypothetical protein GCM10007973_24450 [Polymorphobacter multimanifer]